MAFGKLRTSLMAARIRVNMLKLPIFAVSMNHNTATIVVITRELLAMLTRTLNQKLESVKGKCCKEILESRPGIRVKLNKLRENIRKLEARNHGPSSLSSVNFEVDPTELICPLFTSAFVPPTQPQTHREKPWWVLEKLLELTHSPRSS